MERFFRKRKGGFSPYVTVVGLTLWLGLMGTLLQEQFLSSAVGEMRDRFSLAAVESDDWYMVRIGGAYAGYGRSRQIHRGNEWLIRDDLNIALNIQGQVKPIKIANESVVDEDFRLVSFDLKVNSGLVSFEQKGHIEGRTLLLEIPRHQGGGVKRIKIFESPRISRSLGLPVPLTGLKVGDEVHLPVFDPLDGQKSDSVIKVVERADLEISGKTTQAWRVRAIYRTMELTMWIDDEGRLLKGRMPLNMTVTRSDKVELAREMRTTAKNLPDMMELTAVPVEGDIPEGDKLTHAAFDITQSGGLPVPSDSYHQKVEGSRITLNRETLPKAAYSLPNTDPAMAEYLGSSRFIRSDNKEIIQTARKIVGDEKDPVKAGLLINEWVHKTLKKTPTPGVPDAYTVLLTKQGDCNEHAVLSAALARAVGLPSRVVVGITHFQDGFAYHAWVNYWAGDTWFSADPLTGKAPIGPLYVALLYGDVDKHVNVISYIGKLKLKVVATE